jgi:hypothetical protein
MAKQPHNLLMSPFKTPTLNLVKTLMESPLIKCS